MGELMDEQNLSGRGGDEEAEKKQLVERLHQLQTTLNDLWTRVDTVKEENVKLKSENEVLGQYIESLISSSSVFQKIQPNNKGPSLI